MNPLEEAVSGGWICASACTVGVRLVQPAGNALRQFDCFGLRPHIWHGRDLGGRRFRGLLNARGLRPIFAARDLLGLLASIPGHALRAALFVALCPRRPLGPLARLDMPRRAGLLYLGGRVLRVGDAVSGLIRIAGVGQSRELRLRRLIDCIGKLLFRSDDQLRFDIERCRNPGGSFDGWNYGDLLRAHARPVNRLDLRLLLHRRERHAVALGRDRIVPLRLLGRQLVALSAAVDPRTGAFGRIQRRALAQNPLANRVAEFGVVGIQRGERVTQGRRDPRAHRLRQIEVRRVDGSKRRGQTGFLWTLHGCHITRDQRSEVLIADLAWQQQERQDSNAEGARKDTSRPGYRRNHMCVFPPKRHGDIRDRKGRR